MPMPRPTAIRVTARPANQQAQTNMSTASLCAYLSPSARCTPRRLSLDPHAMLAPAQLSRISNTRIDRPTVRIPDPMSTIHSPSFVSQGRSTTNGSRQPVRFMFGGGRPMKGAGSFTQWISRGSSSAGTWEAGAAQGSSRICRVQTIWVRISCPVKNADFPHCTAHLTQQTAVATNQATKGACRNTQAACKFFRQLRSCCPPQPSPPGSLGTAYSCAPMKDSCRWHKKSAPVYSCPSRTPAHHHHPTPAPAHRGP